MLVVETNYFHITFSSKDAAASYMSEISDAEPTDPGPTDSGPIDLKPTDPELTISVRRRRNS